MIGACIGEPPVARGRSQPRAGAGQAGDVEWVVDGTNVMGSRPDGWWRDRPGARQRLVAQLADLAQHGDLITVYFDGRPSAAEDAAEARPGVTVRFAPGGRNAADDAIAAYVTGHHDPADLKVVTSDAELARRVRVPGASVLGSGAFLKQLTVR